MDDRISPIGHALATLPDLTEDQRRDLEYDIAWSWAIVRRGDRSVAPTIHRFRTATAAHGAFRGLSVSCGWALLFDAEGNLVARRDGAPL